MCHTPATANKISQRTLDSNKTDNVSWENIVDKVTTSGGSTETSPGYDLEWVRICPGEQG